MFLSTLVSMQQEVKIDKNVQNTLVQKVANLASTGDDNVSYKKAQEKLIKKQIEEIGTNRSQGRPINIIKEEKFRIQDEIGELENYKERKQKIGQEKEEKQKEIAEIEENLQLIRKVKAIKERERLGQEKIKITENLIESQEQRKEELEKQKKELQKNVESFENIEIDEDIPISKTKRNIALTITILGAILIIISSIIKNKIAISISIIEFIISLLFFSKETNKIRKIKVDQETKKSEMQKQQLENKEIIKCKKEAIKKVEAEINVLQNNINEEQMQIQESKQKELLEISLEKEKLNKEAEKTKIQKLFSISNISYELEKQEEEKNRRKLEYHSLELEENTISPRLEKVALLEEQLEEIKEKEKELEKNNQAIELTKQILETAYQIMKQNVTPKLTEELSKNIQKVSGGKYSKINLHEEEGIIVEKENGEYVEAEKLSVRHN